MPAMSQKLLLMSFKVGESSAQLNPLEIYDEYEDDPSESEDESMTDSDSDEDNDTPAPDTAKKPKADKQKKKKGRTIQASGAIQIN